MRITYRIPTKDPFAFVEITQEPQKEITPREIKERYDLLINMFKEEV